jgi:hypothetical protein
MRRTFSLIPVLFAVMACAKTETPPADTAAAMAPAPAPEAAPAMAPVTEATVSGTWKGTSKMEGTDSVVSKWTQVCSAGKCKGTSEGSKTTIQTTYTLAGDSAVGVSTPFTDPGMAKGARLIDTWVVHFNGENASGTGAMKLASKPDSVVMRYSFTGSRQH